MKNKNFHGAVQSNQAVFADFNQGRVCRFRDEVYNGFALQTAAKILNLNLDNKFLKLFHLNLGSSFFLGPCT